MRSCFKAHFRVVVACLLASCAPADGEDAALADTNWPPLLDGAPRCDAPADRAQVRAEEFERLARAHWERTPFSASDAPDALWFMLAAEQCYAVAHELIGAQRTHADANLLRRELERRLARTRLLLTLAQREQHAERTELLTSELLDLLARAGERAAPLRAWLEQTRRSAHARSIESADSKERTDSP